MPRPDPVLDRLQRRLGWHQAVHDPACEPRNRLSWLQELRRWQAWRLARSFEHLLADPRSRPAAMFFLTDVYGDHDFSRRDADLARVMPMMRRLMPASLLDTVADGLELGALTQALDLRMAEVLRALAPRRRRLDEALFAQAYRQVGRPRLRLHQIALLEAVGDGLAQAVATPGVGTLLRMSRGPARLAGVADLQHFLERGFAAFAAIDDAQAFLGRISQAERALAQRLFDDVADPFGSAR